MSATRPKRMAELCARCAAMLMICCAASPTQAFAQSMPDTENGRYALAPVADGVLRLDTRTGSMSTCNNQRVGWACYVMPDERAALDEEIGRLQNDNQKLKAQLAERESTPPASNADSSENKQTEAPNPGRKLELTLPSDRDIDRAVSFLERAWRRLVEMANRMQRDLSGKI